MVEPKCPANYFGRGENFNLPDDKEFLHQYELEWQEWERAHPDDPGGEKALAEWKKWKATQPAQPSTTPPTTGGKESIPSATVGVETKELELELDPAIITKFKAYCRLQRKRPRDIFTYWVNTYANI